MSYHFGICEWSFPISGPLAIRLAGELGYEGIQLGEAGGRMMGYPLTNTRVQSALLEEAEASHVVLHSLNLGALLAEGTINYDPNTAKGSYARESLRQALEACSAMGISIMVVTLNPESAEAAGHAVAHLKFVIQLAREMGIEVAIECALPLEQIQWLLGQAEDAKICMDMLNPLRFGTGNPIEQLCSFDPARISHFHMKDTIRTLFSSDQRGCVLLGEGDAEYERSVAEIRRLVSDAWILTENYYYLPPMKCEHSDFCSLARTDLHTLKKSFLNETM